MNCPICGQTMSASLYRRRGFSIVRCSYCKFYAADLDEWVYPYSANDYYTDQIDADAIQPHRPYIQHRVRQIMRFEQRVHYNSPRKLDRAIKCMVAGHRMGRPLHKRRKVVDLGCGLGETAIALSNAGYQTYGVEESTNAIRFLQNTYPGVSWHRMPIELFLEQEHEFDVITLFHVLEHIPKPHLLCKSIAQSLRPEGLLVVEVPDVSGGQARLYSWQWQHWLPHHVNYFSRNSLCRLFEPFGLNLLHVEFKYHLGFPQGILWRDLIHGALARFGMHDTISTYWQKPL